MLQHGSIVDFLKIKLFIYLFGLLSLSCDTWDLVFGKISIENRIGKRSVFNTIPKKGNAKECSNYNTIIPITLKILQARLKWYVNQELPDVQAGFRKDRGTRDQIITSTES